MFMVRWRSLLRLIIGLILCWSMVFVSVPGSASASVSNDRYDGNIFPLYAGNGSIVPPRVSLQQSLKRSDRPTILGFYLDDSSDCKQYAAVWSKLDAYYGRVADIILLSVDSIVPQAEYSFEQPGYYYGGEIPQTVVFNQVGEVVLNVTGDTPFETLDNSLRVVFNRPLANESEKLQRQLMNDQNFELVPKR